MSDDARSLTPLGSVIALIGAFARDVIVVARAIGEPSAWLAFG
jgi:hypothetical protein